MGQNCDGKIVFSFTHHPSCAWCEGSPPKFVGGCLTSCFHSGLSKSCNFKEGIILDDNCWYVLFSTGVFLWSFGWHCAVSTFPLDVSNVFFLIIWNCNLHNPDIKGAPKKKKKNEQPHWKHMSVIIAYVRY
jgi:hypothetical protein